AASDTTYHSFHDIELYEPAPRPVRVKSPLRHDTPFAPVPMRRQDSGYESTPSDSKSASSGTSRESHRRVSLTSSPSPHTRPQTRPSIHRATRSTPTTHTTGNDSRQSVLRAASYQYQQTSGFFHFPSPETLSEDEGIEDVELAYPPPPQTTHYWTSDHTRKLEYAAIDAASRGVKGWILRHIVPDCIVPKSTRRVAFDDDTGSVRRYRLELECEDSGKDCGRGGKKMGWLF
ncbi:uncharacterized protein BCR38DRAFT_323778, partial [Pseudomassariella vexata]